MRVVTGLLKGGIIGFCVGALSWRIGMVMGGLPAFIDYGLIGALVGILGGRPPWRQETIWTPLLKGIFGVVVGIGLYWVAHKFLYGIRLDFAAKLGAPDKPIPDVPVVLGPMVGALWGILVELDDSGGGATSESAVSKRH
ncbi:MAG TPA: hypothetical protein VHK47_21960 [Polyangia bacterium]|jgi:hypothetical protein|nr:hypothetical protein [Polyangia bacterium]